MIPAGRGPDAAGGDPLGLRLVLPAIVIGAFGGSLVDMMLGLGAFPLAKAGILAGPLAFALALNALERDEARRRQGGVAEAERYRIDETRKRLEAARARGDLIRFRR